MFRTLYFLIHNWLGLMHHNINMIPLYSTCVVALRKSFHVILNHIHFVNIVKLSTCHVMSNYFYQGN